MTNEYVLTPADLIWNRAAMDDGGSDPLKGDRHLAALLYLHSLIMNGGVLHGLECLEADEFAAACRGYEFFGLTEVGPFLNRVLREATESSESDHMDRLEASSDRDYMTIISSEQAIEDAFLRVLAQNPEYFRASTYYS